MGDRPTGTNEYCGRNNFGRHIMEWNPDGCRVYGTKEEISWTGEIEDGREKGYLPILLRVVGHCIYCDLPGVNLTPTGEFKSVFRDVS